MKIDLAAQELPAEFVLFGEDASRVVISCDRRNLWGIQQIAVKYGLSSDVIGETADGSVEIRIGNQVVVSTTVDELNQYYERALREALEAETREAPLQK